MQDYEYMYEVCLCSVLEDKSHMTHYLPDSGRKAGSVCHAGFDLKTWRTEASQKENQSFRNGKFKQERTI